MNSNATLTHRESQIAEFLAWGGTKKEIATRLFISSRTVENTARSIYEKTGVTKVNELSAWYFCTHFHISFTLSPLAKSVIAVSMLLLFSIYELHPEQDMLRASRCRRTECRTTRSRKNESTPFEL